MDFVYIVLIVVIIILLVKMSVIIYCCHKDEDELKNINNDIGWSTLL